MRIFTRRPARIVLYATLGAALLVGWTACKKEKKPGKAGAAVQAKGKVKAGPRVKVPKQVMVTVGLKNPAQTIDSALALLKQFAPVPFNREGLIDLMAQRARLPRELVEAIDTGKPFWVVGLDNKQIKDRDPLVMVLPLRSRKAFEAAVAKKMVKGEKKGKLVHYKPKPGAVGVQEMRLAVTDTHVMAPTSEAAFEAAESFIEGGLLKQTPKHDVELTIMVEHLLKVRGDELDKKLDQAMGKMRANMTRSPSPIDQQKVAGATEQTFKRWIDAVKSTRQAQLTCDVTEEMLTVALSGLAKPGGRLAKVVKRQRVGEPYGLKLLPQDAWLVVADRGNPAASTEGRETWQPVLDELLKGLAPEHRERMLKAAVAAGDQFTGDFSMALHKAPSGSGMTLSLVSRVGDAAKSKKSLEEVAGALGDWAKAMVAKSKKGVPPGFKVERRAFSHNKAQGEIFELHLPLPPDKKKQIEQALGLPVVLGIAFVGEQGLGALGKEAEAQLKALVEGAEKGKVAGSLEDNPAFGKARSTSENRIGLVYLSLVDLVRWFEGTGLKEVETIAAALKEQKVTTAPSLDWGVSGDRTRMDLTLRLPAQHFTAFKPILEQMKKRGGPAALFGGGKPRWRDM
jgi:hypothetical protein